MLLRLPVLAFASFIMENKFHICRKIRHGSMDNRSLIILSDSIGVQLRLPFSGKQSLPSTLPPPRKQRCARMSFLEKSSSKNKNMINEEQDASERCFLTEKPALKKFDKFGENF